MSIENHKSKSNVSSGLLLMKYIFVLECFVSSLELPILYYLKHKIFLLTKLLLFEFSILVWRPSSFWSSENLLRKFQRRPIYHSLLTLNGQFLADLNKIGQYWWWLHCSNILFGDVFSLNQNVLTRWQTPPTPALGIRRYLILYVFVHLGSRLTMFTCRNRPEHSWRWCDKKFWSLNLNHVTIKQSIRVEETDCIKDREWVIHKNMNQSKSSVKGSSRTQFVYPFRW